MNPTIINFTSTAQARAAMEIKMRRYFDWCDALKRDPADDESWNGFCEWYGNR